MNDLEIAVRRRAELMERQSTLANAAALCSAEVQAIEHELKEHLTTEGISKLQMKEAGVTLQIIKRHDTRITDAEEFAAAMIENGMDPPMTEPKLDTRALKEIAKKLPDFPGAEPFETIMLKVTVDA